MYYSSVEYTLFTESPKTSIADLVSQVGGALGMFVSFSVFTLFEFIEIGILLLKNSFIRPETKVSLGPILLEKS